MPEKKIILTKQERENLEKEYRDLIDVQRPDVIEKLQLARSQGDLSENADYDAARDRQAQIEGRIAQIEAIINNAVDADESGSNRSKKISIGDLVTFVREDNGEKITVKIAGNIGGDPMAEIPTVSNESPIGKALLGSEKGRRVLIESVEPYEVTILDTTRPN